MDCTSNICIRKTLEGLYGKLKGYHIDNHALIFSFCQKESAYYAVKTPNRHLLPYIMVVVINEHEDHFEKYHAYELMNYIKNKLKIELVSHAIQ